MNNAGITRDRPYPPDELPVALLREIYETNVFGVVAVTNAMLPLNAVTLIYAAALRGSGIKVNALSPGFCATDLNSHTGHDSAAEGGARIARQVLLPPDGPTGVLLSEDGGTCGW
ncbi:MAG: hypothetical protein ACM32E_23300 [Gemmatimonadota bacterium]